MKQNEIRERIRSYVYENSGSSYSEIMRALSLRNGTVSYHLHRLEKAGEIKSVRVGVNRKYYPSGYTDIPLSTKEKIFKLAQSNPGLTVSTMGDSLDISSQSLYYHVKRMANKGMIHLDMSGKVQKIYANPKYCDFW